MRAVSFRSGSGAKRRPQFSVILSQENVSGGNYFGCFYGNQNVHLNQTGVSSDYVM